MAGKTIAVDASIWMHQFLNAMRDKQGNLLNGAHIQGFFRRILKLLYYNVRPLFVFDGAAPALKKRTIAKRQERKASQSQSAKNTASQLLKARMQLYALDGTANPLISPSTQTLADPYSLPEPSKSSNQPYQDARLVSYNEMAHFVDCHNSLLDYSQLNIDSSEFQRLPIETQHAMIIDLKNASRAPNQERVDYISEGSTAIEFSRRQIQQLVYRATLTDRAHSMAKSGKNGGSDDRGGRVAASRNKSFLLVENSNAGVTFQPTDIPRNKKFADISGMNGFASFDLSAKSDIQIYGDMVGDDVPIDEIMKRIKENDVIFGSCEKVLDLSMSNLERYALGESRSKPPESKDPIPTLSYSVESQPPIHSSDFSPGDELFPSTTNSAPVVDELDWDDPPARKAVSGTSHLTSSKDIHIDFNTRRDDVPLKRNLPITKEDIGPKRTKFGHVVDAIPAVKHIPAAPNNSTAHAIESSSEDEWETFTGEMKIDLDVHVVEKVENPAKFDTILELELPTVTEIVSDSDEEWEAVPLQNANDVGSEDQQKELLEIFESNQHEAELEAPESVPYATEVLSDVDEADIDIDQEGDALNEFINSIQANSKEYAKTLNRKIINLESEQRKLKSTSDVVTFQMVQDVQDLLEIFGLPYIVAPLEAESQCASLMECGVVDGIITDDSDVFLFGGSNIYKNLFNQNKMVELYTMDAIRSKMKLGRHELICLAYLVGSDYCYGIKGIGPVKALEIIEQWPGEGIEGLQDFTNWCKGIQCGQVDPSDNPKKAKLRKLATKLEFEQNFPNSQAYDAYINPQVDTSRILLDFKPPNLDRIRIFLQRSLSWEPETTDKYLLPVLKQMQKPIAAQSTIDDYYH